MKLARCRHSDIIHWIPLVIYRRLAQTGPHSLAHSTACQRALLHSHRGLRCIRTNTQSKKRTKRFIVELESETHKIWSKVLEWIPNGMAETELRDTW